MVLNMFGWVLCHWPCGPFGMCCVSELVVETQISRMPAKPTVQTTSGWRADLALEFRQLEQRTVLDHTHSGPLRVQRPFYPEGPVCHVYLVHPPAGIVGGDELQVRVQSTPHSAALVTTPGATQFYRSGGELSTLVQHVSLVGARMDWLPQENIYFDGAIAELDTLVSLDRSSSFIGWDLHCFGRPAANEKFQSGQVCIKQRIEREGKPLLRERLWVGGERFTDSSCGLRGAPICATLVATPVTTEVLASARGWLTSLEKEKDHHAVLTLIDDVLIARYLGPSAQQARRIFNGLWQLLRPEVHQLPACSPRIWAT